MGDGGAGGGGEAFLAHGWLSQNQDRRFKESSILYERNLCSIVLKLINVWKVIVFLK